MGEGGEVSPREGTNLVEGDVGDKVGVRDQEGRRIDLG